MGEGNNCAERVRCRLQYLPTRMLFLIGWIIFIVCNAILSIIGISVAPSQISNLQSSEHFIYSLFLAPIFETLFCQALPIELFFVIERVLKHKLFYLPIIVSAILFAICHYYSVMYIVYTAVIGVVLATIYKVLRGREAQFYCYLIVVLLHGICNLTAIMTNVIIKQ